MNFVDNGEVDNFIKRNRTSEKLQLDVMKSIIRQLDFCVPLFESIIEASSGGNIPELVLNQTLPFFAHWNGLYQRVLDYEPNADRANGSRVYGELNSNTQSFTNVLLGKKSGDSYAEKLPSNFLGLLSYIRSLEFNLVEQRKKIEHEYSEVVKHKLSAEKIVSELRDSARNQSFQKYSRIFLRQSLDQSSFRALKLKGKRFPWRFQVGTAEIWLIIAIGLSVLLVWGLIDGRINEILPIEQGDTLISDVVTRLLVLSTWIYLITFSLKQFSINKHLATLNKHRANALNSFNLFVQTIDKEDHTARSALMLQVAKSIYESGKTGHLNARDNDSSVVELTRVLTSKGGSNP